MPDTNPTVPVNDEGPRGCCPPLASQAQFRKTNLSLVSLPTPVDPLQDLHFDPLCALAESIIRPLPRASLLSLCSRSASPSRHCLFDELSNHKLRSRISSSSRATEPQVDAWTAAAAFLPTQRARRAAKGRELVVSQYRPHVPADRCVLIWTSPFSLVTHATLEAACVCPDLQRHIYEGLLQAQVSNTWESYGAGLLRFHQFCDHEGIPESARMPADQFLLAAFVAEAISSCTRGCIRNWLSSLRLWHLLNDAPWHGNEGWLPASKKSADKCGIVFKRPLRGPVTDEHMRALRASLDLGSPFGAAAWAVVCSAYCGCRRLGELLICSASKFSTLHDTCRETRISHSHVNRCEVWDIHLVWTKTTTTAGGECILTEIIGPDADLYPG
ncbi:hypothetical protein DFH07DRAFT_955526 [Mycena maculata]|uniref:Uncharacterized protein n=1 Tax=Mycena maculata TaxID=230809 RepID=A0AAD7NL73_9AGAR|nr:hypothetical protein DFH07DRAFT_955526 [Mycena maculata]